MTAAAEETWESTRTPCGTADPFTDHPCGRAAGHEADERGHVCQCEAERILERHAPCAEARS